MSTRAIDLFIDAGMLAAEAGVLPDAGQSLADLLLAEGHADVLAELTARFWIANEARKARQDRWKAHAAAHRAALDPGEKEPPAPPPPPPPPPPDETPDDGGDK